MIKVKTSFLPKYSILSSFGFGTGNGVQVFIDNMVIKKCEPYIPKNTGNLIKSAIPLGGSIIWTAPYAKKQYYTHKGSGLRGPRWVERMWTDTKGEILGAVRGVISDTRRNN